MTAVQLSADPLRRPARRVASKDHAATTALLLAAAISFGILLPSRPGVALAIAVLPAMAFRAPLANLSVLLFVTVLVPFELQDRLAILGGRGSPSLLLIDVLLLLGLCRVAVLVLTGRVGLSAPLVIAGLIGLVLAVALIAGIAAGSGMSEAGHEARRAFMAPGAFLLSWPLLKDVVARRRLYRILLVLGLALGIWGIAQWVLSVEYSSSADVGVRPGKDLGLAGTGQLQGGMFAYPVAIALSWAALISGRITSLGVRMLLVAILTMSAICCLLTYERSFWAASAAACAMVVMRFGAPARRTATRWALALMVAFVLLMILLSPSTLRTAVDRFLSIGQYRTDPSLIYRVVETGAVMNAISERPVTGSGFGATITWGKNTDFATITTPFVHNGYLWLAWKLGIPAALLIGLLMLRCVVKKNPADDNWRMSVLRTGSKAALFALLIVSVTFSTFDTLGITAVLGILASVCFQPPLADTYADGRSSAIALRRPRLY